MRGEGHSRLGSRQRGTSDTRARCDLLLKRIETNPHPYPYPNPNPNLLLKRIENALVLPEEKISVNRRRANYVHDDHDESEGKHGRMRCRDPTRVLALDCKIYAQPSRAVLMKRHAIEDREHAVAQRRVEKELPQLRG